MKKIFVVVIASSDFTTSYLADELLDVKVFEHEKDAIDFVSEKEGYILERPIE